MGDNNEEKSIKSGDDDDLDLWNTQPYIYTIELTCIRWKKGDAIDSMKFSILSHLQYIFRIVKNKSSLNNMFQYNKDLLRTRTFNCLDLEIKTNIDDITAII